MTRHFGSKTAADSVSLEIPSGHMVDIIGRSGAGKSTLLRMINRLNDVFSDYIEFEGAKASEQRGQALRNWQRDSAMVFEHFTPLLRLDVITNVMVRRLNGRNPTANLLQVFSANEQYEAQKALERLDVAQTAMQ